MPALRTFVRLNAGPVLRSRETVSDIVQSAVVKLLERSDFTFRSEAQLLVYLYNAALTKIIDKQRYYERACRTGEQAPDHIAAIDERAVSDYNSLRGDGGRLSPSQIAAHKEDLERLQVAFDQLDDEQRSLISMRNVFDLPVEQIAANLGLTIAQTRLRMAKAMARLSAIMGGRD
jgi:RNA polymerase sigma factor (sigma-70 family)